MYHNELDYRKITRHIPNALSILRVLLLPPALVYVAKNTPKSNLIALGFALIIILSDFLDGKIARKTGYVTVFGKYADAVADKICVLGAALVLAYSRVSFPIWFAFLLIFKDLMIIIGGIVLLTKYRKVVQADMPGKYTVNIVALTFVLYIFNLNIIGGIMVIISLIFVLHSFNAYYYKFLCLIGKQRSPFLRIWIPSFVYAAILFSIAWSNTIWFPALSASAHAPDVKMISHRGASAFAPENTLAAIRMAIDSKTDGIEVDVRQTKDSMLVLLHDRTVDRTTNGKGRVEDFTIEELKILDAGSWFNPKFSKEQIPTLDELLNLVGGKKTLWLEIKGGAKLYPGIERRLVDIIHKHGAGEWVHVSSFLASSLEEVHRLDPAIILMQLTIGEIPFLPVLYDEERIISSFDSYKNINAIGIWYPFLTARIIQAARNKAWAVYAWTVNEKTLQNKSRFLGVNGIITDMLGIQGSYRLFR